MYFFVIELTPDSVINLEGFNFLGIILYVISKKN